MSGLPESYCKQTIELPHGDLRVPLTTAELVGVLKTAASRMYGKWMCLQIEVLDEGQEGQYLVLGEDLERTYIAVYPRTVSREENGRKQSLDVEGDEPFFGNYTNWVLELRTISANERRTPFVYQREAFLNAVDCITAAWKEHHEFAGND